MRLRRGIGYLRQPKQMELADAATRVLRKINRPARHEARLAHVDTCDLSIR